MANHKSAIKENRRSLSRRDANRQSRARLRTTIKNFRKAVDGGDAETAGQMLPAMLALVDHTAKLGAIHDNAADRTKSRLTKAFNRISAGA